MKIGILQAGHAPDELRPSLGDYATLFVALLDGHGFEFVQYDVVDMVFPKDHTDCDGWLITGSKHGVYEDLPFIPLLEQLVRDITAADLPLVGVCFGHQIIAQALGGKVAKFKDGWAVGRQVYDWNGQDIALNAWHQDQVLTLPSGAEVVASNRFCQYAALVYGKQAFTVQPHPEFDTAYTAGLARFRGPGVVPDAQLATVTDALDKPIDRGFLAAQIARFFKERTLA
ncbi:type 1 glutamine amidotransferase [Loktanella agnita]|uniref:type 1 glutamine amidotransferase n=1 Tax=Loktanella agnita TaxID=287097 RepID=UPI0039899A98